MSCVFPAYAPSDRAPSFATYSRPLQQDPLLTAEQEQDLAARVANGEADARDQLTRANLRLVAKIARDYLGRGLEMEDLVGEGNLGLIRAAQDFKAEFGTRFSTYASYWIKQAIREALINRTETIRLPAHMVTLLTKWRKAERELTREMGRAPGFEEVAMALCLSDGQCDLVRQALRTRRFEGEVSEDDRAVDGSAGPGAGLERSDEASGLRARMARELDDRERAIIGLRFGLDGEGPLTLKEVGERLGITREWVRKVEKRAIAKLRADQGERA